MSERDRGCGRRGGASALLWAAMAAAGVGHGAALAQGALGLPLVSFQDAFRPDYQRRDLALMRAELGLDDAQGAVLERIFTHYASAFDAGARAARIEALGDRPGPPGLAGRSPAELEALRAEAARLRADATRRAQAATDAEARRAIMEAYARQVRELHRAARDEPGAEPPPPAAEARAKAAAVLEAWRTEKQRLAAEFLAGLTAVLDEPQRARWPALRRRLRREKTLHRGRLSGESVDLVRIVGGLELDPDAETSIAPILAAYAEGLDTALRARNEALDRRPSWGRGRESPEATTAALALLEQRRRLRDVNEEYTGRLAEVLPPDAAARFIAAARKQAYPRIYRATPAERMLRAAARLTELDDQARAAIGEIQSWYRGRLGPMNEALREAVRAREPERERQRILRGAAGPRADRARPATDPIRAAFAARRGLDEQARTRLRGLLTPEQFAALPGAKEGLAAPGAAAGGLIEQFDADGDGHLSAAELEALREHLRRRRGGG